MNEDYVEKKKPDDDMASQSPPQENNVKKSEEPAEEKPKTREEELNEEIKSLNEKYLRLAADFDNFRKRSAKESSERAERAIENFAVEILEVADNIERALKSDQSSLHDGVEQIHKILLKVLNNHSISPIDSLNEQFDPNLHEAIAYIPSETESDGIVIDEVIRGYCMKDKVIRCAKVAVSKGNKEE